MCISFFRSTIYTFIAASSINLAPRELGSLMSICAVGLTKEYMRLFKSIIELTLVVRVTCESIIALCNSKQRRATHGNFLPECRFGFGRKNGSFNMLFDDFV